MRAEYLTKGAYEASLRNEEHKDLREMMLTIDKLNEDRIDPRALIGSQRPPRGLYASQHWSRVYEYPWVFDRLYESLGRLWEKEILDIGPGISPFPSLLVHHGATVTCVDTHPVKLPRIEMIEADIREWEPERKFDAITCISVIEHITDVDIPATLERWLRWTKPGGTVIVTMDIPLGCGGYGAPFGAFADLMWWLCERYGECPRYPGTHKLLSSSDFGEQGDEVGRDIGVFLLEVSWP